MKNLINLSVMILLSLIWAGATIYALTTTSLLFEGFVNVFMILTPFIAIIGLSVLFIVEMIEYIANDPSFKE